jgi:hypothetical protein
MKCIVKMIGCALLSTTMSANAGLWGTTIHSRANCMNNESITWYANHSFYWQVVSFHNYNYNNPSAGYHYIDTGMSLTWRQAAVHWNESGPTGTYGVTGFHYYLDRGRKILDNNTYANDCA